MRPHRRIQGTMFATLLGTALSTSALAQTTLPQPVHRGDLTYVTGGVGLTEQHVLEANAKDYNLAITNSNKAGDFTVGTDLIIKNTQGHEVLRVADSGPLFYAKLPPGDYMIQATNEGQHRARDVKIGAKRTTDVHLIWPQMG